jgi:hypothetical protein
MDRLSAGEPVWALHFDERGALTQPSRTDFLDEVARENVEDLFVISHGWNTSATSAHDLYTTMFPMIRQAAGTHGLGRLGFVGIHWPSLWFPATPATPPPRAGSTQAGGALRPAAAGTAQVSGTEIAEHLLAGFTDPAQQATLREIGRLIDEGAAAAAAMSDTAKRAHIERLHELLGSLAPPERGGEFEDVGETALLRSGDPVTAYQKTAEAFRTVPAGSTQGVGDWFRKAINGVKDGVRVLSYTTMKARAGDIGRDGLGPLLAALHDRSSTVRVHLVGHSFGARLVSFALDGVGSPADSPIASVVLLQAAFSHWSFAHAQDNPFGRAGALHTVADRVRGPLVATFSSFDWAVGIWYPKASFLARQDAAGVTVAPRWGGLGAHGFQAVGPLEDRTMTDDSSATYKFQSGIFYRVNADGVINDVEGQSFSGAHSDIRKVPVVQLIVTAAAAGDSWA